MAKLRLTEILREHRDRVGGIAKLAAAIGAANRGEGGVTEGQLGAIINDEVVMLGLRALEAIDVFLARFGQSLADVPLFHGDTILRALVETAPVSEGADVVFFISTRLDLEEGRRYTSVWDVRAFNEVVESVNRRWRATRVTLREEAAGQFGERGVDAQTWRQLLPEAIGCCCIGAPLVFGLAEVLLAGMFEVTPFGPLPRYRVFDVPFHFVLYPDRRDGSKSVRVPSAFEMTADELAESGFDLPQPDLPQAIKNRTAQAFVVGQEVRSVRLDGPEWKDYGVVVAQRRKGGGTHVVLGGLSGPGTYAAATLLHQMVLGLPKIEEGKASPPVYAVVESTIRLNPAKGLGDKREVLDQHVIVGPQVWKGGASRATG